MNDKFERLVEEVSVVVRENLGEFVDEYIREVALDILAKVYLVCDDNILPEPNEELPTILEG